MSESHKSPPRQPATLSPESPVLMKTVHSSGSYQNNFLEDARLAVLRDLGSHIPEVSFEIFMDHLAPPQPDFNIDGTMKSLKSGRSSVLTASDGWRDFQAPKGQACSEETAFEPIPKIFTKVVKAIIKNSDPKLTDDNRSTDFLQNPNRAPTSAERRNASRPDGYLLLKGRDPGAVSWADVALSCEYKRKDGDEELDDDVRKCLWSMHHVMRDDPRHRATFGMTIQNSTTRLWFCCRSSVVVSEAFDFIAEPKKVVQLFAAFAFADKKSLGFDPTIQPAKDDPTQFIITVHPDNDKKNPRKFRTKSIISSYGAEPLRGRGTRVFEAIELDRKGIETGSPIVLKDIWIDHDRTREGTILSQLHAAADDEDKKLAEKYFLTPICHGDVQTESDVLDNTEIALMRGLRITSNGKFKLQREQLAITKKESAPGSDGLRATTRQQAHHSHPTYPHKTHYRIVFKEKGVTMDLLTSLPEVFTVLSETVNALQLLRKLGWVHRDVSVGNILSYEGGAKLADLEYAKKVGDVNSHEMRTGTIHFMSIEVAAQEFLFQPPRPGRLNMTNHIQDVRSTTGIKNQTAAAPFSHNYLHDLESLWWVAVWMVFYNHFSNAEGLDDEAPLKLADAEHQLKLAQFLFPSVLKSADRWEAFQVSFKKRYADLPHHRAVICGYLDGLRENLVLSYRDIESTLPRSIDLNTLNDDIYEDFKEVFSFSKNEYPDIVLALIPDIHAELKRDAKRPRAESESDIRPRKK